MTADNPIPWHIRAVNAYERHLALIATLTEALDWALPLAEVALEDHRQRRLQGGNDDIGRGTPRVGLWPEEQDKHAAARAALKLAKDSGRA